MAKTEMIRARVEPELKSQAEEVFSRLGLSPTAAITLFYRQVTLHNGLPSLEPRHHDHALSGEWKDHRDCHVRPDLVLIYQKSGADTLRLVRLGSHAELGL